MDSEPVPLNLPEQFAHWANVVRNWTTPSEEDFVVMYGLFKQANDGDCKADGVARHGLEEKKHKEWEKYKGQITKESAMELYVSKAKELSNKYESK